MKIAPEIVIEERVSDEKKVSKHQSTGSVKGVRTNNRKTSRCRKAHFAVSILNFIPLVMKRKMIKTWK
jgi:hypothetical protein